MAKSQVRQQPTSIVEAVEVTNSRRKPYALPQVIALTPDVLGKNTYHSFERSPFGLDQGPS